MNTLHIKKGDTVVVLSGNDKGKSGKVMNRLYSVEGRFTVTGAHADNRLRLPSRHVLAFAQALARELFTAQKLPVPKGEASVSTSSPRSP